MARDPNKIHIRGRLARDPELRTTRNGASYCTFGIASNGRERDSAGNWVDGKAVWWECQAWRDLAEHAAKSLSKGDLVDVTATGEMTEYDLQDGTHVKGMRWVCEDISVSLKYATAQVQRIQRGQRGGFQGNRQPDPAPAQQDDGAYPPDPYAGTPADPNDPWGGQ